MTRAIINVIAPCFIVRDARAAVAFYCDKLGFDVSYQNDEWATDPFFAIVSRDAAMIMVKNIGVNPTPNYTRDVGKGTVRWDLYIGVPDPDTLAAEFASRGVTFAVPLGVTGEGLLGFELKDPDGYTLFFGRPRENSN